MGWVGTVEAGVGWLRRHAGRRQRAVCGRGTTLGRPGSRWRTCRRVVRQRVWVDKCCRLHGG